MIRTSLKTHLLAAAAVATLVAPVTAQAAGFALKEQSISGLGTAFAGITAGGNGDISAMFFNPATMGLVQNHELVQTITGVIPDSKPTSATATRFAPLPPGSRGVIAGNASPGDVAQDAILPAGYAAFSVSPDLKLGLSMNGPWGMVTDYGSDWVGRYHGVRSDLRTYNFTPTVSYRLNPTLIVGGGVQIQYAKAKLSSSIDAGLLTGIPALAGRFDTMGDLIGDSWGVGMTAGVLYQPVKGTRVGLSYRSSVYHELEGSSYFTGPPLPRSPFQNQAIKAKLVTPDVVSLGAYHDLNDRWAIMSDVQWTNWSRFRELNVTFANPALNSRTIENWKDTWFFSVGSAYKATDALTLRVGAAYDQGAVDTEHRSPRIPEADRMWLSIGAGYKVTDSLQLDAAYSHVFVKDSTVALRDSGLPSDPNRGRGNLDSQFKNSIDLIGVQARLTF